MTHMSKVYYSHSKGKDVEISQMEKFHLINTILKLQKERDSGQAYPAAVLQDLLEEHAKRVARGEITDFGNVSTPDKPVAEKVEVNALAALANLPDDASENDALSKLLKEIGELTTSLTSGPSQQKIIDAARVLATKVNAFNASPAAAPVAPKPAASDIRLEAYPTAFPTLLLNSLAAYNVTTLEQLSQLTVSDFGAVRFSTPQAFIEATSLLRLNQLRWSDTSRILVNDGYVDRRLNPNASAIAVFVQEAENRLTAILHGRTVSQLSLHTEAINRVFEGIKRRVALAASVAGMAIMARGLVGDARKTAISRLPASVPFQRQVNLYLDRLASRVASIDAPIEVLA